MTNHTPQNTPATPTVYEDEISLLDLFAFIRSNFRMILGCAFAGAGLALAVVLTITPQWEANALVRTGNAGNPGNPVEPVLRVVDRIKSKSFQEDVLLSLDSPADKYNSKAKLFFGKMKVKLEKSELITLTLRAESAKNAQLQLLAVINQLASIHDKILAPTVNRWRQELASLDLESKQSKEEVIRLKKLLTQISTTNESNFSQAVLISNVLIMREAELRSFLYTKRMLEERLSPEHTFSTQALQGLVEVSEHPVFPNKTLFVMVGLMLGLILGVFIAFIKPILCART